MKAEAVDVSGVVLGHQLDYTTLVSWLEDEPQFDLRLRDGVWITVFRDRTGRVVYKRWPNNWRELYAW